MKRKEIQKQNKEDIPKKIALILQNISSVGETVSPQVS